MAWTLAGRYRLTSSVARGPTGQVWRAVDEGTNRPVAVKLLHHELTTDDRLADRLLRARRTLTALWHPGIARLLDVIASGDEMGLVTDFVPGTDLARQLAAGPLAPARAAAIAATLGEALHAAHLAGVVHGDVKPANVILPGARAAAAGTPVRIAGDAGGDAVLTDFSIATLVSPGRSGQHASPYTPPWLVDGQLPTPSSDVFALGVMLGEMLTGTVPGDGASAHVDRRLWELVEICVHVGRSAPVPVEQVSQRLRELAPVLPDQPAAPRRSRKARTAAPGRQPEVPSGDRGRRRNLARVALSGAAAAVVVAAVVAFITVLTRAEPTAPSPDHTTTATAADQAPPMPAREDIPTQDGGAEFVEYWFAALTYAVRTGDTGTVAGATSPGCQQCEQAVETIAGAYAGNGSLRGGEYVVRGVSTTDLWSPDRPVYNVTVDRSPRTAVDAGGEVRATLPPLSFANCALVLEWTGGQWLVREVVTPGCVA